MRPGTQTRWAVLALARQQPGLRAPEAANVLAVHPSTAAYHLENLAASGHLVRVEAGRKVHYYVRGVGWCERSRRIHAHLTDTARFGLALAVAGQVITRRRLMAAGHTRAAARYAVRTLVEQGVVRREARGVYNIVPALRSCAVAALQEGPCMLCSARWLSDGTPRADHHRAAGSPPRARGVRTPP